MGVSKAEITTIDVKAEGDRVLLLYNGKLVGDLPWDAAQHLGKALIIKGKQAEEIAKVEQVILDQAILTRSGVPFGITNRPDIHREAMKEAAWNSELRRSIPSIKSREIFGTPTIINSKRLTK